MIPVERGRNLKEKTLTFKCLLRLQTLLTTYNSIDCSENRFGQFRGKPIGYFSEENNTVRTLTYSYFDFISHSILLFWHVNDDKKWPFQFTYLCIMEYQYWKVGETITKHSFREQIFELCSLESHRLLELVPRAVFFLIESQKRKCGKKGNSEQEARKCSDCKCSCE